MNTNAFPTKGNLMLAKNSLTLAKQGYELMDGVPVVYSLGNAVFGGNRDPRRCLQLPPDVIAAGLTANPR